MTKKATKKTKQDHLAAVLSAAAMERLERLATRAGMTTAAAVEALVMSPVAAPEIMIAAKGAEPETVETEYRKAGQ